jgi:NADH:ubiquinone oxidoreductase subunit 4 (subunit M)
MLLVYSMYPIFQDSINRQLAYAGIATLAFEVILATMAAEKLSVQECSIQEQWKHMFSAKSLKIKTIQEAVLLLLSRLILV